MADTNGTTNGYDASGGPGVTRMPVAAPSISDRERELALNSLERRLSRHDDLVENFYAFSRQWIGQQTDPRRNLFIECGYPLEPTIDMYRNLYEREPLATRAVEVYPKECWQQTPTVYEDMDVDKVTDFEEAWDQLGSTLRTESSWYQDEEGSPIWDELQRADILSRIGSYGAILLGIDDGKNLQEPLDGVMVTNARALVDSPMTNDEEHRLLHPHGRWQATDVDGLESKSYIHSGPDRVGEAALSRNQMEQVEQWRWERRYQEQGMAPQLAVNTARNRMARKKRNQEIEHVNPCPSCKKSWDQSSNPVDNDGRCSFCHKQVPLASLVDNTKHLYREVSAKSPQEAAKIVQNQVYMERGWWPQIVSVKPLQRSTSAGMARNELEPEWMTNASDGYDSREAPRTRGHRNPNNDERAPTDRGKTLDPRKQVHFDPMDGHAQRQGDFAEVYGTDQQYDDQGYGIGMPPRAAELGYSLSGTDEQYFGVQFGPSEQPAPPTDPATAWPAGGDGPVDQDGNPQLSKRRRPRLLFMRPYSEDLVQVVRYEWNIRNPRFGHPVMYRITLNDPRETQGGVGLPLATVFVHWSRVIHLCDRTKCGGVSSNPTFTIPCLKPVFNSILDAQKVTGAGAEGYYKSCFTGLQFSTHPQMGGDVMVDEASIKVQLQDYQNGLTRGLLSIGGQWSTLAPSVVDPTPHYNLAVEKICIVLGCPVRIFKGSERGELASSQDDESWNKRRLERQVNYLTPRVIVPLIDRLIQVGVLPVPGQKSGKQQVQNILTRQPQAKVLRVNGGWLVTNVRKRVRNTVSPSVGDHASRVAQAQAMDKDNQQRPDRAKDQQALAGQAGGSDAYSEPLTDKDGEPLENADRNAVIEKRLKHAVAKARDMAHTGPDYQRLFWDPRDDYTSQPDSIGPADPANFPAKSPKLTPGYGPAESKSRFENTSRYGSNPAQDTGGGWEPPVMEGDGGAQPWETGQTGVMARQAAIFVSDGGYSVEWPDPEAVGKKDKAAIALQYTQALSAYVQGGCEATMPFKSYLVHIWSWEEELAQEMIDAAKKLHAEDSEDQPLTQPKMIAGQPAEAADGTQAKADTDAAAKQAKAQSDALAKSKAGGIGAGKSGMMNPSAVPNKSDAKIQAQAKAAAPKPPGDEA